MSSLRGQKPKLAIKIYKREEGRHQEVNIITVQQITAYIEGRTGHPLNPNKGVQHGAAERPARRVFICWMATADALAYAGREGYDVVLAHESLYYPYDAVIHQDNPQGWEDWRTNRQRRELLARHDLTLVRAHFSLDEICIFDDFAALMERIVHRIGLPWGGLGLFVNIGYQQRLIERGCDVFDHRRERQLWLALCRRVRHPHDRDRARGLGKPWSTTLFPDAA